MSSFTDRIAEAKREQPVAFTVRIDFARMQGAVDVASALRQVALNIERFGIGADRWKVLGRDLSECGDYGFE